MIFSEAVEEIILIEKDYSNDPTDPGGETRWGISKRSFPDIDIANLTKDGARQIYREKYWDACRCDDLPKGIDLVVFDMAVNQGVHASICILQKSIGASVDGVIGAETIRKSQRDCMLEELLAQRIIHYTNNPLFLRDGLGWMRRVGKIAVLAARDHQPTSGTLQRY